VDIVREAQHLASQPASQFEILVALGASPRRNAPAPEGWLDAPNVSAWLVSNGSNPRNVRQAGGIVFSVAQRDRWSAARAAFALADRLVARVATGMRQQLTPLDRVWVRGYAEPIQRARRGLEIGSLERDEKLYALQPQSDLDAALELVSPLDSAGVGPAVAGAWAAVESLLVVPEDRTTRVIAADRLADLVACSFPRAELTSLAYKHMDVAGDAVKAELMSLGTNRDRARRMVEILTAGGTITFSELSDTAAAARMTEVVANPKAVLSDIQDHAARIFRRVYRQRNLVLHSGRVRAVALEATLRAAAPLIGAGLDRIAHAWFVESITAAELAARARVHLQLVGSARGRDLVDLLEP
jgi:hypothetical protein